ncbi:hypothetical protein HHI36_010664 [Cryptolaemus montrouzieri]|uniref:RNase H type-1 domain-containing protein n=1 Tax=Cryptolaemus montrouzieri TaxID=559131 RepID=A0ABD2MJH0_9CUCU
MIQNCSSIVGNLKGIFNTLQHNISVIPPWTAYLPRVDLYFVGRKAVLQANIRLYFNEYMANHYSNSTTIYTDGSVQEAVCAIRIPELNYTQSLRFPDDYCVMSAEAYAIHSTLKLVEERDCHSTLICSDSLSCLEAIHTANSNN